MWHAEAARRPGQRRVAGAFAAVCALALAWGPRSWAQYPVDTRVNPGVQQNGRLFDVNPALRGGRYNYSQPMSPLLGGNAFATGNVGRGFALQSFSPIADPSTFRAHLGSADLYTFRRDSVSVWDTADPLGTGSLALPYYDPATTAFTTGLLQKMAIPMEGTSRGVGPLDLRMPLQGAQQQWHTGVITPVQPPSNATASSIFGLSTPPRLALPYVNNLDLAERRAALEDRTLAGLDRRERAQLEPIGGWPKAEAADVLATPLDAVLRSDAETGQGMGGPKAELPPWAGGWRGNEYRPGLIVPERRAEASETGTTPRGIGQPTMTRIVDPSVLPGYDVFNDMRLALALAGNPSAPWYQEMQRQAQNQPELKPPTDTGIPEEGPQFVDKMLNTPLRTFTGRGASALNDLMLKAESLMAIGHYREAADRYAAANAMEPANPLPLLGKGHALLAVGDYRSAAVTLLQGLERYPDIARFSLDLKTLMGGGESVDIRRADIMKLLALRETPELYFLLGYLEYHSGDRERGLANLEKAARLDVSGSLISRLPAMFRGERKLPPPRLPSESSPDKPHSDAEPVSAPPSADSQPADKLAVPPPLPVEEAGKP